MTPLGGILAVWNDREGAGEAEYEAWYQGEHVPQRLGFAGFRQARRYEAVAADRRYFTWYALDGVAVLRAPAYLACLETPTPRTQANMPAFRRMVRAELAVVAAAGRGLGGYAVCLRRDTGSVDPAAAAPWLQQPGVTKVQVWQAPAGPPAPMSSEIKFRGAPDGTAASALLVECLREADAQRVARALADGADGAAHVGVYRLLCCTDAA